MSGDLTARDVIARAIADMYGWELTTAQGDMADELLAALAVAGWELHRAGEVVPTSDVLGLAAEIDDATLGHIDDYVSGERAIAERLRALTQQEPR